MAGSSDMFYRIMLETRDFVAGTKITKREFREIRQIASQMAGDVGALGLQFDKFARLARGTGRESEVMALAFGKLSAKSNEAKRASMQYAAQMKKEAAELRARVLAGDKLTAAEVTRLQSNDRIANKFLASSRALRAEKAKELLATRKQINADRDAKHSREAHVNSLAGMKLQLAALVKQIGFITLGYKAWNAAVSSFHLAMEVEKAQLQFQIFTGSLGTAARLMGDLRRIAAETPLTLEVSLQSTRTLLQYGVAAQEVTGRLRQLGDISGGDTERMQRLSLAFGQITAAGRLQGQELRQLVESGFNPLSEISRTTGQDMLDLKVSMAKGKISIDDVESALDSATSAGGRFHGQMEHVANLTTSGKWTKALGQLKDFGATLMSPVAESTGGLARNLGESAQSSNSMLQDWRQFKKEYFSVIEMRGAGPATRFFDWFMGHTPEDPEPSKERFRLLDGIQQYLTEEEKIENRLTSEIAERIAEEEKELEILKSSKEEVELREFAERAINSEAAKDAVRRLKAIQDEKNAHEEKQKVIKEAEKETQREAQRFIEDQERRHDLIMSRHEAPEVKLERQLGELFRLVKVGMFDNAPGVVAQERDRITKEFIDAQVDEVVESQKQAADVSTKGSREEFAIMRQISMNASNTQNAKEDARHKAELTAMTLIKAAIENLPDHLAELIPTPVGF